MVQNLSHRRDRAGNPVPHQGSNQSLTENARDSTGLIHMNGAARRPRPIAGNGVRSSAVVQAGVSPRQSTLAETIGPPANVERVTHFRPFSTDLRLRVGAAGR